MPFDLARPDDVALSRDEMAATRFLLRYQEPTRSGYRLSLKQWFQFCADQCVTPLTAERAHIEVWMRLLEQKGNMASTIGGKLHAVSGFYKLAKIDRLIVDDPTEYLRRPTVPNVSRRASMTPAEALRALEAAKESSPLDHALCCVLLYTGGRVGEICALDAESLGWEKGERTLMMLREKGNRSAPVPLPARASWALDLYLGSRSTGPLFLLPRKPQRIDRPSVAAISRRVTKAAGITKNITPHSWRHTHITLGLNAGVNTRDLVNSLGYADARQIARYDRDKDNMARHSSKWVSALVEGS